MTTTALARQKPHPPKKDEPLMHPHHHPQKQKPHPQKQKQEQEQEQEPQQPQQRTGQQLVQTYRIGVGVCRNNAEMKWPPAPQGPGGGEESPRTNEPGGGSSPSRGLEGEAPLHAFLERGIRSGIPAGPSGRSALGGENA